MARLGDTEEDVQKEKRQSTGGDINLKEELRFGQRLHDDVINTFCDKLRAVCPERLEAFMAIQYVTIGETDDVRKLVTGNYPAIQVLYDSSRSHYVLVHYNKDLHEVELFDSMQQWDNAGMPEIPADLSSQICRLFGHLYTEYVPCIVDREYEQQHDGFSCGVRAVAALVDLLLQRNPATRTYSRFAVLEMMRTVLADPNPTWTIFEAAEFGFAKNYSGQQRVCICLLDDAYNPSSAPS